MVRFKSLALGVLLVGCLALTACDSGTTTAGSTVTSVPPTPTNVPAGWKVYMGLAFSVAYPPTWTTRYVPQKTLGSMVVQYEVQLHGPDSSRLVKIDVALNQDPAQVQSDCQTIMSATSKVTISGRTWWYIDQTTQSYNDWYFFTTNGEELSFVAFDKASDPAGQSDYQAVLATLRPQFDTSACG